MNLDPRIGILCVQGKTVHYAFVNGYDKPETRGSREEVEAALGLRAPIVVKAAPAPAAKPARRARELREYIVTVTVSWMSGYDDEPGTKRLYDSYDFHATAHTMKDAISAARKDYRDREGTTAIRDFRPTYSARRA